jgi:hypothetical protein
MEWFVIGVTVIVLAAYLPVLVQLGRLIDAKERMENEMEVMHRQVIQLQRDIGQIIIDLKPNKE